jgi:hypothetical protein
MVADLLTFCVQEDVQYLTGHSSPRTTRLYNRRQTKVTRNIVERISIYSGLTSVHDNPWMQILQACIVGGLALIGIVLTQSWTTRRDYTKRRLDLAAEVLALFYEVEDAIRFIRSPAQPGDGSTRQRREGETDKEAAALDRAYIF